MNTQAYLDRFKVLEKKLQTIAGISDKGKFFDLVDIVEKYNYLIHSKKDVLKDLSALRNLFSHSDREKYIAEVNQLAFDEIDNLILLLENPPTVGKLFTKDVYSVTTTDSIKIVISDMNKNIYTHVPVYRNSSFLGIFSESTIVSWLSEMSDNGIFDINKYLIGDVNRKYLNNTTNIVQFISEDSDIFKIPMMFSQAINKKSRLGALIITKTGKRDEPPVGIITAWDLPIIDDYIKRLGM